MASQGLFDRAFFRKLEGLRLLTRRRALGRPWGEVRGKRTGHGGEFADHRRYVPGDDLRLVDWPAYWRLRQPYTRLMESREQRFVLIALDASASMDFGDPPRWDHARRIAAGLAFIALDSGDRVTFAALAAWPAVVTREFEGRSGFIELCSLIEQTSARRAGEPVDAFAPVPSLCPGRGLVIIISDFLARKQVSYMFSSLASSQHEIILLHILTPWELDPSLPAECELEDIETGERIPLSDTDEAIPLYRGRIREYRERLRKAAIARGMLYFASTTTEPEFSVIRKVASTLSKISAGLT